MEAALCKQALCPEREQASPRGYVKFRMSAPALGVVRVDRRIVEPKLKMNAAGADWYSYKQRRIAVGGQRRETGSAGSDLLIHPVFAPLFAAQALLPPCRPQVPSLVHGKVVGGVG